MSKPIPIPNYAGKLNADVFVHIAAALKTDLTYSQLPMQVQITCDGEVFEAELLDTLNFKSYLYLPTVLCLLSLGLTYQEAMQYFSKEKKMSVAQKVTCYIYRKKAAKL